MANDPGSRSFGQLVDSRVVRGRWNVLGVAVLAQLGVSLVDQGIPTLTGFVKIDLGLSAATTGLAVSSFAAGRILGSYGAGVAADRLGERHVLLVGGFATGVLVACGALGPLPLLFTFLVVGGIASAASTPAGGRLVLLAFPRKQRGLALGIRQCGIPLGGLIAAALLPRIAHIAGWRSSLAVAGAGTVLLVLPLIWTRADADVQPRHPRFRPLRNRNILLLTVWGCLVVTGQYAILAYFALDLHGGGRFTLATASLLVAFANGCGILGRIFWGALSDRLITYGRKPLLLIVTSAGLVSALLLFALPRSSSLGVSVAVAGVAGLALIGYQGLWVTMIAEAAGPQQVGAATGFAVTFVAGAIAATPPLYGLAADLAGTYRAVWGVLACVLALAFAPALLVREGTGEDARTIGQV